MPVCMIIGCTSGYRSNHEKCHLFTLPRDSEIQELWRIAIRPSGIDIKPGQTVCEKHFHAKEIMWQRKLLAPDGTLLGVSQYKIPRLQKGTVPSIFPWTELIVPQVDVLANRDGNAMESLTPLNEDVKHSIADCEIVVESSHVPDAPQGAKSNAVSSEMESAGIFPEKSTVEYREIIVTTSQVMDSKNFDVPIPPVTLQELILSDVSMPPEWIKQTLAYEGATFISYSIIKPAKIEDRLITFVLKEVIVKDDMSIQINVLGKPVEEKDLKIDLNLIRSTRGLRDLLVRLSGLNICTGTKLSDEQNRDIGSAVYQDPRRRWRHVKCSPLLWNSSVCSACRTARKSAIARSRRMDKRVRITKRMLVNVSPNDKRIITNLQKKYRATQRALLRAKAEIEKLKSTISMSSKKR